MYNPFKKPLHLLREAAYRFHDYLRYRKAVQMADESHAKDGDRYYVMPMAAPAGSPRLIIMDRKNFKRLKFKGYISKNARVRDLVNECFYCTPYANGDGYLNAEGRKKKLALYFSYCQSTRAIRKQKKHGKSKS